MANTKKDLVLVRKRGVVAFFRYIFMENDSLLYSLAVIFYLVFAAIIFYCVDAVRVALLLNCFVFIIVAYGVDMVALFGFNPSPKGKEEVSIFHVFTVCWFLPFLLTLTPVFRDVLNEDYRRLEGDTYNVSVNCDSALLRGSISENTFFNDNNLELSGNDGQESQYFWRILITLAREIVFGSVIVLIPLEFFSLMFTPDTLNEIKDPDDPSSLKIEVDSHKTSRHSLIAAGVLDLVTLIFLVAILPKSMIGSYMHSRLTNILFFMTLMILFFVSFLSSFRAIWLATYYHKNPSRKYQEKATIGGTSA